MLETKTFGGFVAKYKKSFVAKLSLSSDDTLAYYSDLKNELLSYKKIKERTSWGYETFRRGRKLIAKLAVRGKTLRLYVALDPSNFEKAIDVSHVKSHASVPCLLKIKNPRRLGYAKALISLAMQEAEVARKEIEYVDYTETFVYRDLESLIAAGLIKVLEHNEIEEVSAYEVNSLMSDEEAEALLHKCSSITIATISIGLFGGVMVTYFLIPLLLKNGQTIGKKFMRIALVSKEGIRVPKINLFIRALFGIYVVEYMVPVYGIFYIFSGLPGSILATAVVVGILIINMFLITTNRFGLTIHDLIGKTVVVEYDGQAMFDSIEELREYQKKEQQKNIEYAKKKGY
jgi:uncharacterized RDD family membrane protein YckC